MKNYLYEQSFLEESKNYNIFQKTQDLNFLIATKITEIEIAAFNVEDQKTIENIMERNSNMFSDQIEDLVNYTIENAIKK